MGLLLILRVQEVNAGFFPVSIYINIILMYFNARMQNLEAKKMSDWTAKKNRIEEASRKKNEMSKEFANQARHSLNAKLENYEENREAIMSELKDKLKVIIEIIFRNRYT